MKANTFQKSMYRPLRSTTAHVRRKYNNDNCSFVGDVD